MHPTRIFKTPEQLYKAFEEYKAQLEIEAEKWLKVQYVGKEGERVTDKYKLPYTLEGFKVFCYKNYGQIGQYFDNKDGYYSEFVVICSHIREEIRENQILGGMIGVYNPSITQRLNGLTDKTENTHKVELTKKPDWLTDSVEQETKK
jgi:hypothetical protein